MKKITLTLAAFAAALTMNAQNISFESAEGFSLGQLNGQNNWGVTAAVETQFLIDDAMASDGTYSLFAESTNEQYDDGQGNAAQVGAFSPLYTINSNVFDISMDVYLPTPTTAGNGSDVHFGFQSNGEQLLVNRIVFDFNSKIRAIDDASGSAAYVDIGTYSYDTWYELKLKFDFPNSSVEIYLDDSLLYTANTWTAATTVDQFFTTFDNFENGFYADNIEINENLSVDKLKDSNFEYFVNNNVLTLKANTTISNAKVYNILGQEVISKKLDTQSANINLNALNSGVYLVQVQIEGKSKSFKIVKK